MIDDPRDEPEKIIFDASELCLIDIALRELRVKKIAPINSGRMTDPALIWLERTQIKRLDDIIDKLIAFSNFKPRKP